MSMKLYKGLNKFVIAFTTYSTNEMILPNRISTKIQSCYGLKEVLQMGNHTSDIIFYTSWKYIYEVTEKNMK